MLLSHVLVSSLFFFFGIIFLMSGVRTWRMKPELPLLDESPVNAFFRGYYLPGRRAAIMGGPMFISLGFMAVAHSIQTYSKDHLLRELMWVPFDIFLVPFIVSGVLLLSLSFASWPRALIPPAYRDQ